MALVLGRVGGGCRLHLRSPHVVAYLGDDGATGAMRNLHMELVSGSSAAEATAVAHGGLGARGVLQSVAAALRYLLEEAGVVHGDVKGLNVLLGGRRDAQGQGYGGAKLADFGVARLVSDDAARAARMDGSGGRARRCGDAGVRHLGPGMHRARAAHREPPVVGARRRQRDR